MVRCVPPVFADLCADSVHAGPSPHSSFSAGAGQTISVPSSMLSSLSTSSQPRPSKRVLSPQRLRKVLTINIFSPVNTSTSPSNTTSTFTPPHPPTNTLPRTMRPSSSTRIPPTLRSSLPSTNPGAGTRHLSSLTLRTTTTPISITAPSPTTFPPLPPGTTRALQVPHSTLLMPTSA